MSVRRDYDEFYEQQVNRGHMMPIDVPAFDFQFCRRMLIIRLPTHQGGPPWSIENYNSTILELFAVTLQKLSDENEKYENEKRDWVEELEQWYAAYQWRGLGRDTNVFGPSYWYVSLAFVCFSLC